MIWIELYHVSAESGEYLVKTWNESTNKMTTNETMTSSLDDVESPSSRPVVALTGTEPYPGPGIIESATQFVKNWVRQGYNDFMSGMFWLQFQKGEFSLDFWDCVWLQRRHLDLSIDGLKTFIDCWLRSAFEFCVSTAFEVGKALRLRTASFR